MRLWLSSLLGREQQQPQQQLDQRSILELDLPILQARQLLLQPELSLKLRSDFAEAVVAVQVRRQLLWVLDDSGDVTAQLLRLSGNSAAQAATSSDPAESAAATRGVWRRSQAWLGTLRAEPPAQESSGVLPIGLQYTHFGGGKASMEQHCSALLQFLARLPAGGGSSGSDSSSSNGGSSQQHVTASPALRQRLVDAVRAACMPHPARRMLQAEQPPELLMCIVPQPASALDAIASACAAAAAAGIEVLVAAAPAVADVLTVMWEQCGGRQPPAVVLRLQPLDGGEAGHPDAFGALTELYNMMLRADARRRRVSQTSKL